MAGVFLIACEQRRVIQLLKKSRQYVLIFKSLNQEDVTDGCEQTGSLL